MSKAGCRQHHGPPAGKCLLDSVRKELADDRERSRIIEKAHDGRGRGAIWEMSA